MAPLLPDMKTLPARRLSAVKVTNGSSRAALANLITPHRPLAVAPLRFAAERSSQFCLFQKIMMQCTPSRHSSLQEKHFSPMTRIVSISNLDRTDTLPGHASKT
jgi:hypothetical protein